MIGFDNVLVPIYCFLLAIWGMYLSSVVFVIEINCIFATATLFLEFWKRRTRSFAAKWDTLDYDEGVCFCWSICKGF